MKGNIKTESEQSDYANGYEGNRFDLSAKKLHKYYDGSHSRSIKKKINFTNRGNQGKISTYSSSSRITSFLKGNSINQAEITPFKHSESNVYAQLTQKYVSRGAPTEKVREEMKLALQRKVSEIEALRVHRDELKFISYNNPYDMPIKISLSILKEKARTQQKIKDMTMILHKDMKEIDLEFKIMTEYYNLVTNLLHTGEEDLIIDTQQEQKLMIQNLEKETNHLFRQLKEEDKKNAKQIKTMQDQIALLRVCIKQKQDKIRDLKSKICTMHIKLHNRVGSASKEKNLSLSIRKFFTDQNDPNNKIKKITIQEAFIGNKTFKQYSKQILEKVSSQEEITKLVFFFDQQKENITFQCIYRTYEGKMHQFTPEDQLLSTNKESVTQRLKKKPQKDKIRLEIKIKYLLSMKFYFKSKVVGVQFRLKTQKGNQHIPIGNCASHLEHQLLTLINKKLVTLGSFWHQKEMIGVGIWFYPKLSQRNGSQKDVSSHGLRTPRNGNTEKESYDQYYNQ